MRIKKILYTSLVFFLIVFILLLLRVFIIPLSPISPDVSFNQWFKKFPQTRSGENKIYQREIDSPFMLVDKIYRSMEGPSTSMEIYIEPQWPKRIANYFSPELIWLTGYKVELFDENGKPLPAEFMCHNNLNISIKKTLPWKVKTQGTDTRLFTLTEGQMEVMLPQGFGIPVMSNQPLRIDFQVLNHNLPNVTIRVRQRVTIYYKKENETASPTIALYQQSAFITKQIKGPCGNFNEAPTYNIKHLEQVLTNDSVKTCCGNTFSSDDINYNPYNDKYGREYTGHWVIDDCLEVLETDITRMLNLKNSTKVHFFSVHVHPYCESLELMDATDGKSLYKANAVNFKDRTGLEHIDSHADQKGIELDKQHSFELKSIYKKNTPVKHTAMATMFLYLEEE